MTTTGQMIAVRLAMPKTHKVVTTHADGVVRVHETRNLASAQNYAQHMRFRFGVLASVAVEVIGG